VNPMFTGVDFAEVMGKGRFIFQEIQLDDFCNFFGFNCPGFPQIN
jgi:hypothetical protein